MLASGIALKRDAPIARQVLTFASAGIKVIKSITKTT